MHLRSLITLLALLLLAAPPVTASARQADPALAGTISAADPRAAAAGVEILKAGGNAVDAAIATMLALNVVEPQNSGIGGGGFFIRHDGRTGTLATIDGRETAPAAAGADWFFGPDGKPMSGRDAGHGGRSAGVPGNLAMMARAHRRYGKLPWARLFAPAIRLARDGFVVSARMHNGLKLYGRHVEGWAKETYFPADGQPVARGSLLRVPLTAQTLERIARKGARTYYRGPLARGIVQALNTAGHNPSKFTEADLAGYVARDRAPVCGTYRAYKVCGMGPPSSGGITVLMILKQLERFDLAGMGRNSAVAWHLLAESERLAYADRDLYIADPDFVSVPVAGLLDPAYIASRSALIQPDRTLADVSAGLPAGAPPRKAAAFRDDPGTSHLAVVDTQGTAVQITTTINGYFGSGVAAGGIMLNNELPDFEIVPESGGYLVANRVEGGKRPRSSMAPTVVYGPDGKVRLIIGAAGGATIICQVAKAIIGVVDWKLSAQEAIAMGLVFAPRKGGVIEQGSELEALLPALQALGETLRVAPLGLKANAIEQVNGRWIGAADPRSEGVAMDTQGNVTAIERRENELNGAHE